MGEPGVCNRSVVGIMLLKLFHSLKRKWLQLPTLSFGFVPFFRQTKEDDGAFFFVPLTGVVLVHSS